MRPTGQGRPVGLSVCAAGEPHDPSLEVREGDPCTSAVLSMPIVEQLQAICPTVLADICHHRERWISASSPPSPPWPTTAASRPPPAPCTPSSRTCRPTSPASSASWAHRSSTGPPGSSPRRASSWSSGPGGSRPSSRRCPPTWPRSLGEISGQVRLGVIGTTGRWLVPLLLRELAASHPKVHLVVVDATTTSLVPQLAAGSLDLAVVNLPAADPDVDTEILFDEEHVLLADRRPPAGRALDGDARRPRRRTRCCSSRRAPAFRDDLDADAERGRRRRSRPRPRSTACACSPRWPSRASAPRSSPPAPSSSGRTARGPPSPSRAPPAAASVWPRRRRGRLSAADPLPRSRSSAAVIASEVPRPPAPAPSGPPPVA